MFLKVNNMLWLKYACILHLTWAKEVPSLLQLKFNEQQLGNDKKRKKKDNATLQTTSCRVSIVN